MTLSMTGFASLEKSLANANLVFEMRAVNSRYLDLHFKFDEHLKHLEPIIRELIVGKISRGKVECKLQLLAQVQNRQHFQIDSQLVQQLVGMNETVKRISPESQHLSVVDILKWPNVVVNDALVDEHVYEAAKNLVEQGLQELNASRLREGEKLKAIILERIAQVELLIVKVKPLMPALAKEYQTRLEAKLIETIKTIDQERIAQELVLFSQRIDVDEELSRLTAHLSEVKRVLAFSAPAGKRLDFLMQELNREANTLGSKSVSVETTQVSVELKVLIEQMREQIQNIE